MSANPRDAAVLRVLKAATKPMTPSDIARTIREPWCFSCGWPSSAPVSTVLNRIGAVKIARGQWIKPSEP